ncbi:MAG: glycoside hydrolase family 25 protein [Lachnospiraceae bacterium]|nr:glycoside hydrolase family 25 protein [Lachnospiraceae bacterium]MBP3297396.1 glycoside hydrolase family 25 protein [Lachnospiraceae bacterium]
MEPGMEIREEHKKEEEQQREEHERVLQKYRERKKKSSRQKQSSLLLMLYGAILLAAVVITILAMLLREEKKERARAEAALAQIQQEEQENPKLYTQEALDDIVVQITEDAAEEQRQQIRDELRTALEEPGAGMTTTLRSFYSDYVFYQIPGGYRFVPVEESRPKNEITKDRLEKDEHGWYQYVVDGEVRSVPMLDVSQFQGEIDWQAVADAGIRHAMIRLGYRGYGSGKLMIDECFEANVQGATEAGIEVGVYFFSQAISDAEAHEEAELVLEQLKPYAIDLPVAIDVEPITTDTARADALDKADRTRYVRTFLEDIRAAGYTPMIYGGVVSFFEMLEPAEIQDYLVWYAFYDNYIYYPYPVQGWQYSEKAHVPGVTGIADMNMWIPLED